MAAKPTPTTATASSCDAGGELLPLDDVFNILLLLPVMSLLRFKTVCKSWRLLIESSTFVNQHLHHHHHRHRDTNIKLMIMNRRHKCYDTGNRVLNFCILSGEEFQVAVDIYLPGFSNLPLNSIHMIPCNGIICLYRCYIDHRHAVYMALWNPATKQLRVLPRSPFPLPSKYDYPNVHIPVGFGLDVKTNEYKVVRFCVFMDDDLSKDTQSRVDVYTLTTDSWRNINTTFPVDIKWIVYENTTPYLNGICYWVGVYMVELEKKITNNCIVSFDLSNEVFGIMPLPDGSRVSSCVPHLAVLKDKIACINDVNEDEFYEIWVLNEFDVEGSWSKLHKIGPFSQTVRTGLLNNGDFFFLVRNKLLCIYDLVTHEIKNLSVNILQSRRHASLQVAEYKESLISVKGGTNATNRATCVMASTSPPTLGRNITPITQGAFHWDVVLGRTHISGQYQMRIPSKIARKRSILDQQPVVLTYNGRRWSTFCIIDTHGNPHINNNGWKAFAQDTRLREGDGCYFEISDLETDEMTIKVHILDGFPEELFF